MSDGKSSLDALRIDRAALPPLRGPGIWIGVVVVAVLLAGGGAAFVWWPARSIPVQAVTAEANGGASGGAGLDAAGYVTALRQATLSAKINGKLVMLNIQEGQNIKEGEIVARLDDSDYAAALHAAIAQEQQARAVFADAALIYARYKTLQEQHAISMDMYQTQMTNYDTTRAGLVVAQANVAVALAAENDTIVRAPFSGVVTDTVAHVGEIVSPGAASGGNTRTGIATVVDMDSLEVDVDVSENYIERVHAGGQATIVLDAYPEWEIPASVIAVIPTADQTKGTVTVRVAIKARDPRILPEMGARVTFLTDAQTPSAPLSRGVTVPLQAVEAQGRTGNVFVIGDDDTVKMRAVTLGLKTAQTITIVSGVAPGDRLAVADFAKLHDGVKVAIQQ